jgi:uncharacterized protein (DUF983 family)
MSEAHDPSPKPHPVLAGLIGCCPHCGKGKLFKSFMAIAPSCTVCGQDFSHADSGDGPAIFVMLIAGFIVIGSMLVIDTLYEPPIWLLLAIFLPLAIGLNIGLIRPFKGILVALQFHHKAGQGRQAQDGSQEGSKDRS